MPSPRRLGLPSPRASALVPFTVLALGVTGALAVPTAGASPSTPSSAAPSAPGAERDFIVVLDDEQGDPGSRSLRRTLSTTADDVEALGAEIGPTYDTVLAGFAATLDPADVDAVRALPEVDLVVPDTVLRTTSLPASLPASAPSEAARVNQRKAPWGLDRIDQRRTKLNNRYKARASGRGVTAYVVDSGIRRGHRDFRGRVGRGYSAVRGGTDDCFGHGTHVSGTLGGRRFGAAKRVRIVPVRVFGCRGETTVSALIGGLNFIARNAPRAAVVNMSLGGPKNRALNRAVTRLVKRGISVVVAAGNEDRPACSTSPASAKGVIVVGASRRSDRRAGFSNYGRCVDILAPGVGIRSDWPTSDSATEVLSGTSMASPHVAGVVAMYLQKHRRASPRKVTKVLIKRSTKVSRKDRAPRLLYSHVPGA